MEKGKAGGAVLHTFGEYSLNTRRCELLRAGQPRHLEPQVYAVLYYLVEHRSRMVTREELLDHIWGHRFVEAFLAEHSADASGGPRRVAPRAAAS